MSMLRELNLQTPLMNTINSIVSLKQNKTSKHMTDESNLNDIISSFTDDLKFCFKILILDDISFKFISPLIKKSSLSKNNICLTLNLSEKKEKIDDVMAIYIVTPSPKNFQQILIDIKQNTYQNYSFNFIEKPDDNLFEEFLTNIIKSDEYKKIYNFHVFPIKYSLIHPKIFDFCSLDNKIIKPYSLFNYNLNNKETENYYDLISNLLFNCLFSMKVSPLIKFRRGSFSELIVNKIQNKFISTFNKFPKLKKDFQFSNCLMIILERDLLDLPIMLHHASCYGALLNDICGFTFNEEKNFNKKFKIDPINDYVWNKSFTKPFYEVSDEILVSYKKYEQQMKILTCSSVSKNLEELNQQSEKLADSIKNIDNTKTEGEILEKHCKFCTEVKNNTGIRNLGGIYQIEKKLLEKREINKEINDKITSLINENLINSNNHLDIFRLCLIYFIVDKDSLNKNFIMNIINKLNIPTPYNSKIIIEYFDLLKKSSKDHSANDLMKKLNENEQQNKTVLRQVGGATKYLFKKGFNFIKGAVNALTNVDRPSIATSILDDLIYNKKSVNYNETQINKDIIVPIKSSVYQNIILFTLGGGSLNEFEYCSEYTKSYNLNFIYGADKIYSPEEFLLELNEIAGKSMMSNKKK